MTILTKELLNKIYEFYHNDKSLDPIWIVRKLKNQNDLAVFSFIAALFSYGNIKNILNFLNKLLENFQFEPYYFIKNKNHTKNINYRFQNNNDINDLLSWINLIILKYGNIDNYFYKVYQNSSNSIVELLDKIYLDFNNYLENQKIQISHGLKFLINSPYRKSTCKRLLMFLRWNVRKDNIDLGIFNFIKPRELLYPMDIHLLKIAKYFNIVEKKQPSFDIALEFTEYMKKYDRDDPVKYDYSLCHWDINNMELK